MRKMPFYTAIKAGILRWKAKKVFDAWCLMQEDGDYTMWMEKTICPKTNEQLGYFHAVIVPTAFNQIKEFAGEGEWVDGKKRFPTIGFMVKDKYKEIPMTEEVVVSLLKQVWATNNGCEVKSKADMSIEECSDLIEISKQWCERYLGCKFPKLEEKETNQ
ncbi:MAG: hypothetical protein MUO31_06635 [Thermodesulfovibrionales bacterium]|nr:hypothetical protein [Thermodesulfovibrionales bacterium]